MDNLRWILLLCGLLVILGIIAWEIMRHRTVPWENRRPDGEGRLEPGLDPLFDGEARAHEASEGASPGPAAMEPVNEVPETVGIGDLSAVRDDEAEINAGAAARRRPLGEPGPSDKNAATKKKDSYDKHRQDQRLKTEDIIAISVMAKSGRRFSGPDIRNALERVGMRYGDMGIFHHSGVGESESQQLVFSAANVLEPGSFDFEALDTLYTPGLMLFIQLTGEVEDIAAFDLMLEAGEQVAEQLEGELRDETRSSLTPQSISHLRERIKEYARRHLLSAH
jgi:cell division protein ZipA